MTETDRDQADLADELQVFVAGKWIVLQAAVHLLMPLSPLHIKFCQCLCATRLMDYHKKGSGLKTSAKLKLICQKDHSSYLWPQKLSYLFRRNFLMHKSGSSYIVERHLAEQSVHQLVHVPGSRLQVGLFYQHLSGFLQTALQHITHHLHRPQTKCLMSGNSHNQIKNDWY